MSKVDMSSKTVLVSGATAGIGKVTALELARMGARVVLIGRSESKCEDVVTMIRRETGNKDVEYLLADLSSMAQTRAVAEQFLAKYDRLNVLVNNVGAMFTSYGESVDGIENTFALNHLSGYFLLTTLLLDVLKRSAPARIVSVSSGAHYRGKINFDDLGMKQDYSMFQQYSNTKLMNVLFTKELAHRLTGSGVMANALHPGFVASNFGVTNNTNWWMKPARWLMDVFAISEEDGAKTSLYLASSPEVANVTGEYFTKCEAVSPLAASEDRAAQQRLWTISEELVGVAELSA